ncbi:preprotein translocase subunit YajC [Candidatus Magnetaquicoccus inordinatus]|uniref:preprotein translocase subunit YajC n=1 Tax=Candidatus Magnetaquicoccus inordinatus TaxID=2496818 RepID=UPI001D0EE257|nr:preprotein translocase subunit YajC [Candidatus Magnetaquicoccus inordinatus]
MFDLISSAYAAPPPNTEAVIGNIVFMLALFGIFYFFLIRPQQKQAKAHKEMVANLTRGDTVVTGGGLMGRIHRVEDDVVVLEVGDVEIGNKMFRPVRIRIRRVSVAEVAAKGTFAPENKPSATDDTQG